MKALVTCRYAATVAGLTMLALTGLAHAQINATVQWLPPPGYLATFAWQAGSLAIASFDGTTMDAALPGVHVAGVAFLFPGQQRWVGTGAGPVALVAADLDGDGDIDVAVAEQDSGSVSVLTNDGLGGFARTASYATGEPGGSPYPAAIAAVDINGDARMDLVVVNSAAETVVVFRNIGGGFVRSQTVAASGEPCALATGDFDADGWMDVAVACAAEDSVKIIRNNHGVLGPSDAFEGGPSPVALATADLNNDGHLDLAAADHEAPQVTVLLNDGAGQFASQVVMLSDPDAFFEPPVDLQLVDLDADGLADIRCAGMSLLNQGGANFSVSIPAALAGAVYAQSQVFPGTTYLGIAYRDRDAGIVSVATRFLPMVIHVSMVGNDANYGSSWSLAKRTIQAGLNEAVVLGDQVWVAAGTYVENVILPPDVSLYGGFAGTEASLSERNWTANVTVLDGDRVGSVITIPLGAPAVRIDGFTIRNGTAPSGGGICCGGSESVIANNTITGNTALSDGGGIYCNGSSLVVMNNSILANSATARGGGIYCSGWPDATITNTAMCDNSASTGGGVYSGSSTLTNVVVAGNSATTSGGGIYCSSATIANAMIQGNNAATGGGVYAYGSPEIANTTIVGNSATEGGGIWCRSYSSVIVANTILAFNSSGLYCQPPLGTPSLRRNCMYGNVAYDYSGLADPTGVDGNISADPAFTSASPGTDGISGTPDDSYADLHLLPGSPCIDAAGNADVPADTSDLDSDGDITEPLPIDLARASRFGDDPGMPDTGSGTAPIVDIGAYERGRPVADVNGDWLVDVMDLLSVVYAFGTCSGDAGYDAACDFNQDACVDVVDLLELVSTFGM